MIKEADWNETENQVGTPPEPDVLVKYVEGGDSNNQEEFSHGGQKVARQFSGCQALDKFSSKDAFCVKLFVVISSAAEGFSARSACVLADDMVTFDHPVEGLSIN